MSTPSTRIAGVSFFVLGAGFLTLTMLAASIAPGYDFHGAAISDLGVIDSTATLFNGLLVACGVLNAVGGWLFFQSHRRVGVLAAYAVASVGAIGVGVFPLSTGALHSLFALVAFLAFNLEALATATIVAGPLRAVSIAAGLIGLAALAAMIVGDAGNAAAFGAIGHGGTERLIAYPAMLWLLALGGDLMGRTDSEVSRGSPDTRTPRRARG